MIFLIIYQSVFVFIMYSYVCANTLASEYFVVTSSILTVKRDFQFYLWALQIFIKYFDWRGFANWICCIFFVLIFYLLFFGHTFALWVIRSGEEYNMLIIENINIETVCQLLIEMRQNAKKRLV